jgi:hypothetical protein
VNRTTGIWVDRLGQKATPGARVLAGRGIVRRKTLLEQKKSLADVQKPADTPQQIVEVEGVS